MGRPPKGRERDALLGVGDALEAQPAHESFIRRLLAVPAAIIPISLFSFGGPPAHLALAHDTFVYKKKWLSDERFLEMLSIASALPGPSSTQVVTSMGLLHAGPLGGLTAFFFWVLPGFTIMSLAGIGAKTYLHDGLPGWMAGFAPAAVSLVVIAAVRLWQKAVGEDMAKGFVAALSSCVILATQGLSSAIFPLVLLTGGLVILLLNATGHTRTAISTEKSSSSHLERQIGISPLAGVVIVVVWFAGLVLLAVFHPQDASQHTLVSMFYTFYWIGSIIFGGGQVMLPMLLNDVVARGWVSKEQFLAGFALIQSLPGPLFNISAYLGALLYGPVGALLAALGLFGPGISLFFGLLPLWERVRANQQLKIFLAGVNAAATGLVVASIFLLGEKAVHSNGGAAVGLATGFMVALFKVPAPLAIVLGGLLGFLLTPSVLDLGQEDFCAP